MSSSSAPPYIIKVHCIWGYTVSGDTHSSYTNLHRRKYNQEVKWLVKCYSEYEETISNNKLKIDQFLFISTDVLPSWKILIWPNVHHDFLPFSTFTFLHLHWYYTWEFGVHLYVCITIPSLRRLADPYFAFLSCCYVSNWSSGASPIYFH